MTDRERPQRRRRPGPVVLAVIAAAWLLRLLSAEITFLESAAIVVLLAAVSWVTVQVRQVIRTQRPSVLDSLPPQPSDWVRPGRSRGGAGAETRAVFDTAPQELSALSRAIRAAAGDPSSYQEGLKPTLERVAAARARRTGRDTDLSVLLSLADRISGLSWSRRVLMTLPWYARRVRLAALAEILRAIEEL